MNPTFLDLLDPVPFTLDVDEHLGLSEVQGLLSASERGLLVEYRIADTVIGALKSAMKVVAIPFEEVASLTFDSRFFGLYNRITLRVRRQEIVADLPGAKLGEARLAIRRRDRRPAEQFCLDAAQVIARRRGELIDRHMHDRLGE